MHRSLILLLLTALAAPLGVASSHGAPGSTEWTATAVAAVAAVSPRPPDPSGGWVLGTGAPSVGAAEEVETHGGGVEPPQTSRYHRARAPQARVAPTLTRSRSPRLPALALRGFRAHPSTAPPHKA